MFGFIKRLFGGGKASAAPSPCLPEKAPMPVVEPLPQSPRGEPSVRTVFQRDEILDARTRIAGYRFSVRRADTTEPADAATAIEVLAANRVAAFAERRIALIELSLEAGSQPDYRRLLGANSTFLLPAPENENELAAWLGLAAELRQGGGKIALRDQCPGSVRARALAQADFLIVDFSGYALVNFEKTIGLLRAEYPALQLIADQVGRWPEYRYCVSHGVAYCIGAFATLPDEEQACGEISQSRLVLIEMLNQLRQEVDLGDIVEVAKRDPGVVLAVIAMANSPALGMSRSATSVEQAIMILGREQLYRWLSIAIFRTGNASPRDDVLLELALARGRFLEIVSSERSSRQESDELFLLGLLSLLDCLLGVPMTTVVERIHLSPALKEVLLTSGGPLARHLMLAIAVEKGHVEKTARLSEQLDYGLEAIEYASMEALQWAESAVRLSS